MEEQIMALNGARCSVYFPKGRENDDPKLLK